MSSIRNYEGRIKQMMESDGITREEAKKKGIEISDPEARKHVYGMSYEEWKSKYQK